MPPVPIYVKGGVWSNLEDQILKAAIQKYGTHQWSKVASLLQRKTAKQCESRWDEFLNPKLNFQEFDRKEDAKLLDLAKKLPNQWRTIADLMGRPAHFCIERYNKLLETPDDGESDLSLGSSLGFKVGDINPNAETQVAKPDNEELEDDEREMLAEARARLLNTQGKKATRKIRERMLEESKRVAYLQKRRELKQAGIDTKIKPPKKKYSTEIDYNADIVYEQQPLPGIYDTTKEDERGTRAFINFQRSVDRRGLKDDNSPHGKSKNRKDRKRKADENIKVSSNNSVVTNEFKKPKLELPAPNSGFSQDIERDINEKRLDIINSKLEKSVLSESSSDLSRPISQEVVDKEPTKKSVLHLFAELPEPRNDFEIALEDEDEEMPENQQLVPSNTSPVESPASTDELFRLPSRGIERSDLPIPNRVQSPKTETQKMFNEILVSALADEAMHGTEDALRYQNMVEQEISKEHIAKDYKKEAQNLLSMKKQTPESLIADIESSLNKIHMLQSELEYVTPLSQYNEKICKKMCGTNIPTLSMLQKNYHVYYKMYQNEYYAIEERKKRLQQSISSVILP